jgi:hypothetical protein
MAKLYFSTSDDISRSLIAKVKKGELIRIYRGIYTDASYADVEKIVYSKWHEIVNYLFPSAIAAYRTAHELRPVDGVIYIVKDGVSRRKISIGGMLTIELSAGNTSELTEPFLPTIFRSSPARQYLENLALSRTKVKKSLGKEWVEQHLSTVLRRQNGEDELNNIRDQTRIFAIKHGFEHEFSTLENIISSLLSTHPYGGILESEIAIAISQNTPFDVGRIDLFHSLADYLLRCNLEAVPYTYNKSSWKHLAFFESYFSNFIEGTEFEIDEAEEIVFTGSTVHERHEDSHDVLAVFNQVSDLQSMSVTPSTADELIEVLQQSHFDFMRERKNKRPGKFKERVNKAGSSVFVHPSELVGTLTKAFDIYITLPKGLESAIFMQFIISECHPFDDGNGRLSRIMMNRELHSVDLHKIIVPTVHRDSYLNGLRKATRSGKFATIAKVFYQLQHYSASIDWDSYGDSRETLEEHKANLLPDEGVPTFNKVIRKFKFTPPPE